MDIREFGIKYQIKTEVDLAGFKKKGVIDRNASFNHQDLYLAVLRMVLYDSRCFYVLEDQNGYSIFLERDNLISEKQIRQSKFTQW